MESNHLWPKLEATEIYECKHKYLEGSLIAQLFNTVNSLLEPMISPGVWAFDPVYNTRHEVFPVEQAS